MAKFYNSKLIGLPNAKVGSQIFKLEVGNKGGNPNFSKFKGGTKWPKNMVLDRESPI